MNESDHFGLIHSVIELRKCGVLVLDFLRLLFHVHGIKFSSPLANPCVFFIDVKL